MEEKNRKTDKIEDPDVKKKRNKSTKKSLAVENEKRRKLLNTLLKCDRLPSYVTETLKQENEERGHIYRLNEEDIEKFGKELHKFVKEEIVSVEKGGDTEVLRAVIALLQYTAVIHNVAVGETFTQIAKTFNLKLGTTELRGYVELQNEICQLSETCCLKKLSIPGDFYLNTFNFLFDLTLDEKADGDLKPEIKRMWEMHVPLNQMNLRTPSCDVIVSKIMRVVVSPSYLSCKDGRQFIAFTFTLDTTLTKKFHQAVKVFLPKCKKSQATIYGEVYYTAWVNGSSEVRQVLETHCIQKLMTFIFTSQRKKQEFSQLGQNVFAILTYLHHNRTNTHFSKILTELYMPLLWRHLRSGNNIERCNAAEVFLDVYPLEKPGSGKAEESDFFNKQHSEMVDLLTDDCHIVRIIAIKGICNKLCTAWRTFPQETIQVLMRNLFSLSSDGSHASVRRTLYENLNVLLLNEESAIYLARCLPTLSDYLNDENEKVRKSFIKLLCEIKNMPNPAPIKYWKVAKIEPLACRLEVEGPEVGTVLSKLLMSNIYSADQSVDKFLRRLTSFIKTNSVAARKLFQFSSKVIDYINAVRIVLTILLNLRSCWKRKEIESNDEQEKESQKQQDEKGLPKRKKRRSTGPLEPISENKQNISDFLDNDEESNEEKKNNESENIESAKQSNVCKEDNNEEEEDDYSKPVVAHALLDIVSLLWSIHSKKFADPANEQDHNNILDSACAGIPLFLKHYKGTTTYWGVVHLASLVPAAKLTPVSTVCSACVSHLKQICDVTPEAEIKVIIHALCSWNRFADIQDMVVDWLDQAFRCEGLNQSQAPTVRDDARRKKVRFLAKGGKPMLALKLLDHVFAHPLNTKRVLEKSYNHIYDLYVYLDRIKILVERRLLVGLPLDSPMLSDEFLLKCIHRYSKLIVHLQRPEPFIARDNETVIDPFDASEVYYQFVLWVIRVVEPMIPEGLDSEPDMSVQLLQVVLMTAANIVDLGIAGRETIIKLAELIKKLLASECSMWFVGTSMNVMKHIKDHSEAHYGPEDKASLIRTVVPSLLTQILKTLSDVKYSKDDVAKYIKNLIELKAVMFDILKCLRKLYGPRSDLLTTLLKLFTDSMVACLAHDVRHLQLLDTVDHVHELPYVCVMLIGVVARPPIASLWVATIPDSISELYSRDSFFLASAVSLLHTLARSPNLLLPKQELSTAVRQAYASVTAYTRDSTLSVESDLDSHLTTDSLDVKKIACPVLSDVAVYLNCTLR